ncbi:MAG: hypothetical protein FWD45_02350 [Coriobacteriia bacterium]|nr:hypothetical protein [Coriobacteriia bacterium]
MNDSRKAEVIGKKDFSILDSVTLNSEGMAVITLPREALTDILSASLVAEFPRCIKDLSQVCIDLKGPDCMDAMGNIDRVREMVIQDILIKDRFAAWQLDIINAGGR